MTKTRTLKKKIVAELKKLPEKKKLIGLFLFLWRKRREVHELNYWCKNKIENQIFPNELISFLCKTCVLF